MTGGWGGGGMGEAAGHLQLVLGQAVPQRATRGVTDQDAPIRDRRHYLHGRAAARVGRRPRQPAASLAARRPSSSDHGARHDQGRLSAAWAGREAARWGLGAGAHVRVVQRPGHLADGGVRRRAPPPPRARRVRVLHGRARGHPRDRPGPAVAAGAPRMRARLPPHLRVCNGPGLG